MAVPVKQAIDISFAQGLDTKTDPKRVRVGNFRSLENSIFDRGGQLQKRNGFQQLTSLPDSSFTYLTTFKDNLTAIGTSISAYDNPNRTWIPKGLIQPLTLSTSALIRNNFNQLSADSAVATNGLVCVAYRESTGVSIVNKFAIYDSVTTQSIIDPTLIPVTSGAVSGGMRVFIIANSFVIVFTNMITGVTHLQYIAIDINNPNTISANTDITASYVASTTLSWDGFSVNNSLFIAYNTTSGGQSVKVAKLTNNFIVQPATTFVGAIATMMSVTADISNANNPFIYVTWYDLASMTGFTAIVDQNLNLIQNPVQIISAATILNITSAAQNGTCKIFAEVSNAYSYDTSIPTNFIDAISITPLGTSFNSVFSSGSPTITASSAVGLSNGMYLVDNTTHGNIANGTTFTISGTTLTLSVNTTGNSAASPGDSMAAGTISSISTIIRSVGLASKAFIIDGMIYFLAAYQSNFQPTYFLIDGSSSLESSPVIAAKLAYENGGGYLTHGLPGVTVYGNKAQVIYRYKDLIAAVNKTTAPPKGTQTAGVYSQTGINLANFVFTSDNLDTSEIGNDLHLSGGFLWMYDGQIPVEHNFFLFPDTDASTTTDIAAWSTTGGNMAAQPDGLTNANAYWYQFIYEWTDNQGNAFRSAPSIPVPVTTTGNAATGSVTLNIPTLRLTYKINTPVKITIYRWSVAQQIYYQITSITTPLLNDTTIDQVTFVDTLADASILGNNIIYTNGGVVEDVNAPASNIMTLFDTRLWLVDAEDPSLLWFSKQVIENTPVEMSDLFTFYVAPSTGAETSTGPIKALAPMDDKLIIFKENAIFYINGRGPDNTGANNQYSEPIFVNSTIGCSNQLSVVFIPQGLLFQSNKGIWLLDRSLNTSYLGAPVQQFTLGAMVQSAQNIPTTNQVRFLLDTGITLMYDYFYGQWGTFTGIPGISSCIFQQLHTFINDLGQVYQEDPGSYLDGSNPVLMSFITGPIRLGDLQNFQRTYFYYLLGTYISPHKLYISNYYDYSDDPSDSRLISPTNPSPAYGNVSPYGQQSTYGGPGSLENWRIFAQKRCMALAIGVQEIYDPSFAVPAGAGLTLSGISLVCGFKSPFKTIGSINSAG